MSLPENQAYEIMLENEIERLLSNEKVYESLLDAFWSGNVPDSATLDHMVLAKAGRLRLEEKSRVCALLIGKT